MNRSQPDVTALQAELYVAHVELQRLRAEAAEQRNRADQAEAEGTALREALARDTRWLEQSEAERKWVKTQRDAAQAARDATQAELASWTAGKPLARAWRAFWQGR